ncbi:MAG: hypothetical protein MEP44_07660 [Blastomonas sp.]|nr:hypothetical protein [Blastomonas sp.]
MAQDSDHPNAGKELGEGNYKAAQNYREAQEEFAADKGKVEAKAREAADALDGAEGDELQQAEDAARDGHSHLIECPVARCCRPLDHCGIEYT